MKIRSWAIAAACALVGLALLIASLIIAPSDGKTWWSYAMVDVGTAVLLFVPLYILTRWLDRDVKAARREAKADFETVSERVESLQADVERRLSEVAESVGTRLAQEHESDREAVARLRSHLSFDVVNTALHMAQERGLIGSPPPRVRVQPDEDTYVSFELPPSWKPDSAILLNIESVDGETLASVRWHTGEDADNALFALGRRLEKYVTVGIELDVASLFEGLADLLEASLALPDRRSVVELVPPQWIITADGLVTYGPTAPPSYFVDRKRFGDMDWVSHIERKPWGDHESIDRAFAVATARAERERSLPPF